MLTPGFIVPQVEPAVVTCTAFDADLTPSELVTATVTVKSPVCVNDGAYVEVADVAGRACAGVTEQTNCQPSATMFAPEIEATEKLQGGPPLVQSPLMTGSGAVSAVVSACDVVAEAQEPPGAVGEVRVTRAFSLGCV